MSSAASDLDAGGHANPSSWPQSADLLPRLDRNRYYVLYRDGPEAKLSVVSGPPQPIKDPLAGAFLSWMGRAGSLNGLVGPSTRKLRDKFRQ